ncbi:MAG: homoserine O-succinyltransferase [Alphaproteobacteria bacterium]|nr:homoserine O-succinyltransferase [Alphaproteobacteria bacterium]NCQ87829.1 homoserine O-succinyltransferase [Alphaproteobacteria bacterium]NCT05663.1 homoserine O-succinyltransferase [Alphaproteobacteria bacterium]
MPIIKHSDLPTYDRLLSEGRSILPSERAMQQDIRELHIGFLNIMPDAALEATERQFFRLVGESNRVAQIYIHPFTLPIFDRDEATQAHIKKYYEPLEQIQNQGLDALIVTGANEETNPHVSDVGTWGPLRDILDWAYHNVTSTICSCFASHAMLTYVHEQTPTWRDDKRWGVYSHRAINRNHPLIWGMNTRFDIPHSRYSEITREQFEAAGMDILVESAEAGVHMATSKDGFRQICFQGHPEYDTVSLFKEYKREVTNYLDGARDDYPPFPLNYFNDEAIAVLEDFKSRILKGDKIEFPEAQLEGMLENTWADSARSSISSWIGNVYQVTNVDRTKPFMDGIDPKNPLGL